MAQPLGRERGCPVSFDDLGDAELVGLDRGGGEGQRDLAQPQLEQPVAAPRLAVVVALRRRPAEDFDLAGVEPKAFVDGGDLRSEEHTSELQSLMRISYAVFCLNKKK